MIEFSQTMVIALALAIFFVGFVVAFATVCMQIEKLLALVSSKRKDRRFFRKIEGFRHDFE